RPSAPATPLADVSALLLPYSADLEDRLDGLKRHLRDSASSYVDAYGDLMDLRSTYEHELLAAGGGELIRGAVSNPDGIINLPGVPEGEWLLLGWREDTHAIKPAHPSAKDAGKFTEAPVSTGYGAIAYWRRKL